MAAVSVPLVAAPITEPGTAAPQDRPVGDIGGNSPAGQPAADPVPAPELAGPAEIQQAAEAFAAGDLRQCWEKLRTAYVKQPNIAPPKIMFARMLLSGGLLPQGRQVLEQAAVDHENHPELYLLLGQLAIADGRLSDAKLNFEKAQSLEIPDNWTEPQRNFLQRECLAGQTAVAERRGQWHFAAEKYKKRVEAEPQSAELRHRWAMALFLAGDASRAFEQFDYAYRLDETRDRPNVAIAAMLVDQGKFREADKYFAEALKDYPDDPKVHFARSAALLYEDRLDEAEQHAGRAAGLGMNSPLFLRHRSVLAMQRGDFAEAQKFCEIVLAKLPEDFTAKTNLALALVEQNDKAKHNRALEVAQQAAQQHPQHPQALAALGWVHFRLAQYDKAEPLLRAAAEAARREPMCLFFLTCALYKSDKKDESRLVAEQLRARLDQPGIFVFRSAARKWVEAILRPSEQ